MIEQRAGDVAEKLAGVSGAASITSGATSAGLSLFGCSMGDLAFIVGMVTTIVTCFLYYHFHNQARRLNRERWEFEKQMALKGLPLKEREEFNGDDD